MDRLPGHNEPFSDRRKFIGNTIKLAVLGSVLSPIEQACKSKSSEKKSSSDSTLAKDNKSAGKTRGPKQKKNRHSWNQEKLVINQKTNVIHLPTAAIYHYYDQVARPRDISISNWEGSVQGEVHLNKDQSGNILEVLSLQKLRAGINDESIMHAINTLARAFAKDGDNKTGTNLNARNFRLHELMLQLVALNNTIPINNKWQAFNDKVKKPQKLGKRQKWMETEKAFNDRVKYIVEKEADYKKRLSERASKYSLT